MPKFRNALKTGIIMCLFSLAVGLLIYYGLNYGRDIRFLTYARNAIAALSLPGFLFSLPILRRFGGLKSVLGKVVFSLSLSFIFQIASFILYYFVYDLAYPYPLAVTLLFALMYISWGLAAYYFLISIGAGKNEARRWGQVLVAGFTVGMGGTLYGLLLPTFPYAENVLEITIALIDIILVIEALVIFIRAKRLHKALLQLPVVFLAVGLLFQFFGDVTMFILGSDFGFLPGFYENILYSFSWVCLALITVFLENDEN